MRLEVRDLRVAFGDTVALDRVDLRVDDAGCLVLVGPSGGGKSTLLRVLGGLLTPDRGTVAWDGGAMAFDTASLLAHRRRIGLVFQEGNLFPHMTARRNITLPLEVVHGLGPAEAGDRADEVLRRFGLAAHAARRPAELSGGQRQRAAVARAVASDPRLLLLDEPTSALDPEMAAEVLDLIEELRDGDTGIVLVTHQMAFARRVADRAAFLADGRVVEAGQAPGFFDSPRSERLVRFLDRILRY